MKNNDIKKMLQARHGEIFTNYRKIKILEVDKFVNAEGRFITNYRVDYDNKNYFCSQNPFSKHSGNYEYTISHS